ncbi:MAG: serine hydrolase, partial [Bacilli bacterium]
MKYLELYRYINELSFNQNLTETELLHDIFLKKDYYHLLLPVLNTIKNNRFSSLSTIRYLLFVNSGLKAKIEEFVYDREITPGVILDFGTKKTRDTVICGNKQEYTFQNGKYTPDASQINYDTIFDLASTSKIFTMISILKLKDMGLIDLFNPINYYVKEFVNLDDVTIYDLLKFRVKISTDKR